VVLGGFIFAISYAVKLGSEINIERLASLSTPLTEKIGLSQEEVGQVAGEFVSRISDTGVHQTPDISVSAKSNKLRFLVISDSHDDNINLENAINYADKEGVSFIAHLGDLTDWGDLESLNEARGVLYESSVPSYVLPGDHDQGQTGDLSNFINVFESPNRVITIQGEKIVFFDNSANFTPLSQEDLAWFENNIRGAKIVLLAQPLYHPIVNATFGVMGVFQGEKTPEVYDQAQLLLGYIRDSQVEVVIAGDRHNFSKNSDPVRKSLTHVVSGALGDEANKLMSPRVLLVSIDTQGSVTVEDVVIE